MSKKVELFWDNGYPIDHRLDTIKVELKKILDAKKQIIEEDYKAQIENGVKKPVKKTLSPYMVKCFVYKCASSLSKIDNSITLQLSKEQLNEIFNDFIDLVAWINEYAVFIPTKQTFCAYSGISNTVYNDLLTNGNDEQKEIMEYIDNAIIDFSLSASENGIAKERSTMMRLTAKNVGHSVVKATPVDDLVGEMTSNMSIKDYNMLLATIVNTSLEQPKDQ